MKKLPAKKLIELIEGATIDCYDDSESRVGFCTMMEDNFSFPFEAKVVGEKVEVIGVKSKNETIEAVCKRNGKTYMVEILNIDYNPSDVKGYEWIEAYREWSDSV